MTLRKSASQDPRQQQSREMLHLFRAGDAQRQASMIGGLYRRLFLDRTAMERDSAFLLLLGLLSGEQWAEFCAEARALTAAKGLLEPVLEPVLCDCVAYAAAYAETGAGACP